MGNAAAGAVTGCLGVSGLEWGSSRGLLGRAVIAGMDIGGWMEPEKQRRGVDTG